jgi:hypothetical protein
MIYCVFVDYPHRGIDATLFSGYLATFIEEIANAPSFGDSHTLASVFCWWLCLASERR